MLLRVRKGWAHEGMPQRRTEGPKGLAKGTGVAMCAARAVGEMGGAEVVAKRESSVCVCSVGGTVRCACRTAGARGSSCVMRVKKVCAVV